MRNFSLSPRPLCAALVLAAVAFVPSLARAQERLALEPPLSQAFPLAGGAEGIHVLYPVLINDHTIIHPDALLRFVYIDNSAGTPHHAAPEGGVRSEVGPHGTLTQDPNNGANVHGEGPASAWGADNPDDDAGIYDAPSRKDEAKRGKQEMQAEVWTQKDLFSEAFDHATDVGTTLVYSTPAKKGPVSASIDPPEGMLLAEVGGHVRVLGLSPGSRAYAGGIRAGDEIRTVGGSAPLATLDDFLRAYADAKHQAKISGNEGLVLGVWRSGQGDVVPVRIAAPPSIPSFF